MPTSSPIRSASPRLRAVGPDPGRPRQFVGLETSSTVRQPDLPANPPQHLHLHRGVSGDAPGVRRRAGLLLNEHCRYGRLVRSASCCRGSCRRCWGRWRGYGCSIRTSPSSTGAGEFRADEKGLNWLTDPDLALFSVTLVNAWRGTPSSAITVLAGLQAIPPDSTTPRRSTARQAPTLPLRHPAAGDAGAADGPGPLDHLDVLGFRHRLWPHQRRADERDPGARDLQYQQGLAAGNIGEGAAIRLAPCCRCCSS